MNTFPEVIIISGCTATFDSTELLQADLTTDKLPSKIVNGRYQGSQERSLIVVLPAGQTWDSIKKRFLQYLKDYKQECLLYLSPSRRAYTVDQTGHETKLGSWCNVSKEYALKQDSYTFDGNEYYCVR